MKDIRIIYFLLFELLQEFVLVWFIKVILFMYVIFIRNKFNGSAPYIGTAVAIMLVSDVWYIYSRCF